MKETFFKFGKYFVASLALVSIFNIVRELTMGSSNLLFMFNGLSFGLIGTAILNSLMFSLVTAIALTAFSAIQNKKDSSSLANVHSKMSIKNHKTTSNALAKIHNKNISTTHVKTIKNINNLDTLQQNKLIKK